MSSSKKSASRKKASKKKSRSKKSAKTKKKARSTRSGFSPQVQRKRDAINSLRAIGRTDDEIAVILRCSIDEVEPGKGQPRIPIDWDQLRELCKIGATHHEIASVMGISKATLDRRRQESPEFRAFMDAAIAEGDTTLRRFQWKAARDGVPAMQIWLGKQRLAQKQNPEPERKRGLNLRVRYDDKGAANLRKNRKRLAKDRAVGSDDELDA